MEALDKIKEILGMVEVVSENEPTPAELSEAKEHLKFEEATLEDGTIISADSFDIGNEVFIVVEDERQAMPIGEYVFADGTLLVVEEEGIIARIGIPEEEVVEEVVEESKTEELSETETGTKDALVQAIGVLENLVQEFASIKEEFNTLKTAKEEAVAKVEEFEKVGEGITPSPEGKTSETKSMVEFSKLSPQERVAYLINKNQNI
jgi:hypothetical protein|tara:strand:+ start:1378 stop:1995 length:618 start_codon:yes stop_codon:yes gene_type:complete